MFDFHITTTVCRMLFLCKMQDYTALSVHLYMDRWMEDILVYFIIIIIVHFFLTLN